MKPSVQKVHALLRRAGFRRSVGRPSRIRGVHNYNPGYRIQIRATDPQPHLRVTHHFGSSYASTDERERQKLVAYRDALQELNPVLLAVPVRHIEIPLQP